MKKILTVVLSILLIGCMFTGCASLERSLKDTKSDFSGGLDRVVIVYTADGTEMARYEGKIDIANEGDSKVKFDYKGKRYIYYNCFVEVIEK